MQSHGWCEEDRERLAAFVLGALSAEERTAVERHLASGCDACRQEVAALHEVGGLLALAAPAVEAPAALRHRLRGEIRRGRERRATEGGVMKRSFRVVSVALAVAAPLGAQDAGGVATPAERHIAQARQSIGKAPTSAAGQVELAMALARRARETSDPAFYAQAEEAIAKPSSSTR